MPTRLCPLLLALSASAVCMAAERADQHTLVPSDAFQRMRPSAQSHGPATMPRIDHAVEPASFKSVVAAKPLRPPEHEEPTQSVAKTVEAEMAPSEPPVIEPPTGKPLPPADSSPSPAPASDQRLLSRPTREPSEATPSAGLGSNPLESLMAWRPSTKTLTATGGGLAIAVGLLMSFVWLIRSCAPKSSRPLPKDVVEVLGRLPLGGKQMTQLIRVGSKLVLVAITPDGAETLTEITDPDEVARLIAACDAKRGRGESADFDRLLHEMADERTTPGFLDDRDQAGGSGDFGLAEGAFDPRSLAAAYANTPGGRGDG